MLNNSLKITANAVFISFVLLFNVQANAFAQNTLEGGSKNVSLKTSEVKMEKTHNTDAKFLTSENDNDEKITACVNAYLKAIFDKDYEAAAAMMEISGKTDSAIAKLENWRERFMAPSNIKILNIKKSNSTEITATFTFEYKNQNGVADIIRGKIGISRATLKIKTFVPAAAIQEQQNPKVISSSSVNGSNNSDNSIQPTGKGYNQSSESSGNPANGSSNVVTGANSSAAQSGSPNIASIMSALNGANSGNSGGNMNVDPGALLNIMNQMMNDPDVLELATNPKLMEIAKDPSIMDTLLSGNKTAISNNPKVQELMNDPAVQKIVEKMKNKLDKGSSDSTNESSNGAGPSQNINADEIFE